MVPPSAPPLLDGRYEVGGVIGRGAMGEVHGGTDRRLERPVAIKRLRRDLAADPAVRARFETEARAAAALSHPHVVAVYDTGECDGVPYIVMERLPGRTLADRIAEGPIPSAEVVELGVGLAAALGAAHAAGVLHRDVKPSNVLLDADGRAKLADFGIAKSAESAADLTATGTVIGSPAYLAPERLDGRPASEVSDLYALAVVLYEAATGTRAFLGDTPVAVAHAVCTASAVPLVERLPHVDPALAAAVDAGMARDPADRPPSAERLAALLLGAEPPEGAAGGTQVLPVAGTATAQLDLTDDADRVTNAVPIPGEAPPPRSPWRVVAALAAAVVVLLLGWGAARGDGAAAPAAGDPANSTTTVAPTTTATTAATTTAPAAPAPPADPPRAGNGGGNGHGRGHGHH